MKIYEITWTGIDSSFRKRYLCKDIETARDVLDIDIREAVLETKRKRLVQMVESLINKDFSEYFPKSYFEDERDGLKKVIRKVYNIDFSEIEAPFDLGLGEFEGVYLREVKVLE